MKHLKNISKKTLILGSFLFLGLEETKGQFNIQEDSISFSSPAGEAVFYSTIELQNTSDSSIELEWELVNVDLPNDWEYTYTVGFDWYGDTTISGKQSIEPSKNNVSFFVVQYYPNQQADTAKVAFKVRMTQDTTQSYIIEFEGFTYSVNSVSQQNKPDINFYPNPLKSGTLPHLEEGLYSLYDLQGQCLWVKTKEELNTLNFSKPGSFILIRRQTSGRIQKRLIQITQ